MKRAFSARASDTIPNAKVSVVGVTAGASTPDYVIEEVERTIALL